VGETVAVEFRVLGAVEAVVDGRSVDLGHTRQRGVLAVLLVEVNQPVPVDRFVDRVWGEQPPQRGRDALYSYLSRLRAVLAPIPDVVLRRRSTGYVLTVDEDSVDLRRFRRLIDEARAAVDDREALALFDDALALWRGEAFADLDSPWFASVRTALEAERRAVELDRTDAALRCGQHSVLLAGLTSQAAQHPVDERLVGQLMLALYRAGRQADALSTYQRLRVDLAEQLGTDPNPSLQQLHQQILTADPGLAPPGRPAEAMAATPRQLPLAPAGFAGRANELATLTAALTGVDGTTVLISALAGAGGIGKTWLVLHWAHTHVDRFPDGQLFVDLRGFSPDSGFSSAVKPLAPESVLRGFLEALGVGVNRIPSNLHAQSALFRSLVARRRMLIVLDNVADAAQVMPLLPGSPTCTVVVTSRRQLTSLVTRYNARHIQLGRLTDADARQLLIERLGAARVAAEPAAVDDILSCCAGFPLALALVAGRAHINPAISLTDLAAELRDASLRRAVLDDDDPDASVFAVLSWSLPVLTDQERRVFGLLGIAPGPDSSLAACASLAGLPAAEARNVLGGLETASLIDRTGPDRYRMHDIVRLYAKHHASSGQPQDKRQLALRRAVAFYLHTADKADRKLGPQPTPVQLAEPPEGCTPLELSDEDASIAWFKAESRCVIGAQQTAFDLGWHDAVWQLATVLEAFHVRSGNLLDAVAAWRAGLTAAAHNADPTVRISSHRRLGGALARMGQDDEALANLGEALTLAERTHNRLQQALTHRIVAWVRQRRGEDRQAIHHAKQALRLYRELGNPRREADALNAVGWCAARLGDYDDARLHCQAALELHRRLGDELGEAATLDSLAFIDHHTGRYTEAVNYYRHALTLLRRHQSAYAVADTLEAMGYPLIALGQPKVAVTVWHEALALYQQQGRDDDAARIRQQLQQTEA
jgi:DNA-binding SARP family transcriptional activator